MAIKIDFEFETPYGKYADALIFEEGQPVPSDDQIEALKLERLEHWIVLITTPDPSPDEEVIEEA